MESNHPTMGDIAFAMAGNQKDKIKELEERIERLERAFLKLTEPQKENEIETG